MRNPYSDTGTHVHEHTAIHTTRECRGCKRQGWEEGFSAGFFEGKKTLDDARALWFILSELVEHPALEMADLFDDVTLRTAQDVLAIMPHVASTAEWFMQWTSHNEGLLQQVKKLREANNE